MQKVVLTIIIATYNSERTLSLVLESIKKQTYILENIRIIIVDGGSKDSTIEIARKFGCKIINNPRTEPVYGKFLGYLEAKSKYIMYLDHDEVIENKNSIKVKIKSLEEEKDIKIVIGSGYKNPKNYPFINNYINEFGDPFSFFIYRLTKDNRFFLPTMQKRYRVEKETFNYVVFDFRKVTIYPLLELVAGGSVFDASYLKKTFPETLKKPELLPHFFYFLIKKQGTFIITKQDALLHYSSDVLRKYFNKINWRIKNNIYHISSMGVAGFTGRNKLQPKYIQYKKYLFLPYVYSLIFPLIDSLILVYSRRDVRYILHIVLCLYTANMIVFYSFQKILGIHYRLKSYDESKIISL